MVGSRRRMLSWFSVFTLSCSLMGCKNPARDHSPKPPPPGTSSQADNAAPNSLTNLRIEVATYSSDLYRRHIFGNPQMRRMPPIPTFGDQLRLQDGPTHDLIANEGSWYGTIDKLGRLAVVEPHEGTGLFVEGCYYYLLADKSGPMIVNLNGYRLISLRLALLASPDAKSHQLAQDAISYGRFCVDDQSYLVSVDDDSYAPGGINDLQGFFKYLAFGGWQSDLAFESSLQLLGRRGASQGAARRRPVDPKPRDRALKSGALRLTRKPRSRIPVAASPAVKLVNAIEKILGENAQDAIDKLLTSAQFKGSGSFANIYTTKISVGDSGGTDEKVTVAIRVPNGQEKPSELENKILNEVAHSEFFVNYLGGDGRRQILEAIDYDLFDAYNETKDDVKYIAWLENIIAGVKELHQLGYVHADLKPENIGIVGNRAKIFDFGSVVSKFSDSRIFASKKDSTPMFMSPEYWLLPEAIKERKISSGDPGVEFSAEKIDIFAVGLIGLEMLSGNDINSLFELPVKGNQAIPSENLLKIMVEYKRSPKYQAASPSLKKRFDILLEQINPNPQKRDSAEELLKRWESITDE